MRPIPSLNDLYATIRADFRNRLNLADDDLKKVLNAFDLVVAAQFKLAYLFLSDIQDNVFPDKADLEVNGGTLERQGRIFIGRNPLPATAGVFQLSVTGVAGSVLRDALTFKSNEGTKNPGQLYILDDEYILTGSADVIEVRSTGAGADFDLNVGDNLTITEPVIGVSQTVVVAQVVEQPLTSEDIEVYRRLIIESRRLEPQGGAATDYRIWAGDVQGVRTVYPYVKDTNAGVVEVYVEATPENSTDGFGTPSFALLQDVTDVINFDPDETLPIEERGRRPIQAILEVKPINLAVVAITITGLATSSTAIRQSIFDNIKEYLFTVRPFIPSADLIRDKNDILYAARVQSVVTDTLDAGNSFTGLQVFVDGSEITTYGFDLGEIPYIEPEGITYL